MVPDEKLNRTPFVKGFQMSKCGNVTDDSYSLIQCNPVRFGESRV